MKKSKSTMLLIVVLAIAGCMSTMWRGNAIRDRLSETPGLAAHDISIDEREGGLIVLSGTVSSDRDRDVIERVARKTRGVREVRNDLVVAPTSVIVREGSTLSSDNGARAIVSETIARLQSSPEIRNYNLNVEVDGDTLILRGEVGNEWERAEAERIARNTRGINVVRNEITVLRPVSNRDYQISQDVREVLLRSRDIDLRDVNITTRDGVVTISGSQSSHRAIDRLIAITETVDGVRAVRNELSVAGERYGEHYRSVR